MPDTEYVVLLDEAGNEIGTAPKSSVHGTDTALPPHLRPRPTRREARCRDRTRARGTQTCPGVWTTSFCGPPPPAEPVVSAVRRRAEHELGISITSLELALPLFRYRAVDASGIVEHEICPVYTARTTDELLLNPNEVADFMWVRPEDLARSLEATPWAFSPWLVLQAQQLDLFREHRTAASPEHRLVS